VNGLGKTEERIRGINYGYAIDVDISTDGEFVMSGDTGGYVCCGHGRVVNSS